MKGNDWIDYDNDNGNDNDHGNDDNGDNDNNEYDVYNDVYNDDDHGDDNEEDDLCRGATLHKQFGNFKISSMGRTMQSSPALL